MAISYDLKGLFGTSSDIFKLATEFYNVMTQYTRIDTKFLAQLLNCCWISVEVHQPVTANDGKQRQVSVTTLF
jgi:hypothetical protein